MRLRAGLEGPDTGLEGRLGTIVAIHEGEGGRSFLSVEVDAEPSESGEPLRQVYVAPSQIDVVDD